MMTLGRQAATPLCRRCRRLTPVPPASLASSSFSTLDSSPSRMGPSLAKSTLISESSVQLARRQTTYRGSSPFQQGRCLSASLPARASKKSPKAAKGSSAEGSASTSSRYPQLPDGWQAVIGVECHVQLKEKYKLFSTAPSPTSTTPPNTVVTPFDAAHPGTLPTLNPSALQLALRTALALNCQIHSESRFDRKHYFYSDLPAGYQITQKYAPLANYGQVHLKFEEGYLPGPEQEVIVEIEQLQLEQDTAKSTYFDTGTMSRADEQGGALTASSGEVEDERAGRSFVDLNRAGAGLMEIVSGPQMRTPEQAGAYVRKLQELVRRVGASDGNMQDGSLRCDVNVSVNRIGDPFGTRCEVKNLNSVRFVMNAISYESHRQFQLLEKGERVEQETRGYDEVKGNTFRLRGKEDAPDYRYMPDPNLPTVLISQEQIEQIKTKLPELPDARRARLHQQYGLPAREMNVLMRIGMEDEGAGRGVTPSDADLHSTSAAETDAVDYFEEIAKGRDARVALNWIIHELMKASNARNLPFRASLLPPAYFGELIDLVEEGKITGTTAKSTLAKFLNNDPSSSLSIEALKDLASKSKTPLLDLLKREDLLALNTKEDLVPLVQKASSQMPDEVAQVKKGNLKVAMRIVGQVMKDANGRADAKLVHQTILEELTQSAT